MPTAAKPETGSNNGPSSGTGEGGRPVGVKLPTIWPVLLISSATVVSRLAPATRLCLLRHAKFGLPAAFKLIKLALRRCPS
jgi:hypothetical protein